MDVATTLWLPLVENQKPVHPYVIVGDVDLGFIRYMYKASVHPA